LTREPLKEKESREIDSGLLGGFLFLQTVYPAVCDIGLEKSVSDRADALSEAQNKRCMGRGNIIKQKRKSSTQGEESPKG